jgi:DNA-binding CsgD family transcriptional regulator
MRDIHTHKGSLTDREKEILAFIANGFSTKQIADRLHISPNTVANHRKNMLAKTRAKNSTELVLYNVEQYLG